MHEGRLAEMVKRAQQTKFSLPPEISCQKTQLPEGILAYVFRHKTLGELGRLLILPHRNNQSQLVFEVVGDSDDPMTAKRRKILEPIAKGISEKMALVCGSGTGALEPYALQKERQLVKSQLLPCEKCGAPVALLIFAPDAFTVDRLEDYARMMFAKVKELNVPTWVIGAEEEVKINGEYLGKALILKIWPKRAKAKKILPTEFDFIVDKLMQEHC